MQIAMVGSGYVGLVSGACFADFGHKVCCIDKDAGKIEALKAGKMPIYEPGLAELVMTNVRQNRLTFADDLSAVRGAQAVFIAVGTPSRRGDGHADLTYVYQAAREIAAAIEGFTVIVTKSTVPVGTGDEVERIIREARPDADFAVVSNPEFLREGAAISDFKRPDRIVLGLEDQRAEAVMREVYRRSISIRRRSSSPTGAPRNSPNMRPTPFSPPRSPSSTRSRACAKRSAPMSRISPAASASTTASARSSCTPAPAMAVRASPRHPGADQDGAGLRHAGAHRRDGRRGQRSAQARHGPQGAVRLRRLGAATRRSRCWG